ncbi:MAG: carbohydrate binding family 9 domain-containing protein [Phycisphaerae bacterium]|nr:carbohydrate binding family 9 domain-containing protein [Gemmatimonadaceae bacterium]
MKRSITLLAVFVVGASAAAQGSPNAASVAVRGPAESAVPFKATARAAQAARAVQAPVLDGKLDDVAWQTAPLIDEFLEYEPLTGAVPRFKTELRILYDDKYLYVMGRMFDPAPDSIISLLSRRDVRTESEQLKLVIDSYHDRRTAYQFITNPAGVKRDFYVYNDNTEDATWDAVWDVSTSVDSLGWTAEFRIPFSQIRFNRDVDKTFGLLVVRDVARTRQRISWPLLRRDRQGYVSQGGEVAGIQGLPQPRRLEVTPYVVTKNETRLERSGAFTNPQSQTTGADLKLGVGSNLTLDATINPDFGQVEADPSILNLGAFEQLFEERRPFFLEGAGIYQFRTACGDIDTGCTGLFYSRRIGRSPQLGNTYRDPANPTATRILGAAKLSGRLSSGLSIGMLSSVTNRERGGPAQQTLEPQSSYTIARVSQDLRGGQSGIGGMVTMTRRALDNWTENSLRRNAYTGGIDFRHRFFKNNYEFTAYVAGSSVDGTANSIAATQRSSVHQYNRPDDGLIYDPTRTRLGGNAGRMSLSKFGGGITRFQSVLERFSPGFESNDVGFLTRADQQMFRNWFSLQFIQPTKVYRRLQTNFNTFNTWNTAGLPIGQNFNTNWHMELPNTWWLHAGTNINDVFPTYDDRVSRGGPAIRRNTSRNWNTGIEFDRRKWYTPVLFFGGGRSDEGNSRFRWVEPSLQFRVSTRFSAQANLYYEQAINDDQWVSNITANVPNGVPITSYTFARLDQHTLRMTGRINYTATRTLSMQLYAQPFISSGDYTNWKKIESPRARRYADRYVAYSADDPEGFNVREFRSNTVVRWEFRPASTLFFVWQQGRSGNDPTQPNFDFNRDVNGVFGLHPMNTFLIKASYWINP